MTDKPKRSPEDKWVESVLVYGEMIIVRYQSLCLLNPELRLFICIAVEEIDYIMDACMACALLLEPTRRTIIVGSLRHIWGAPMTSLDDIRRCTDKLNSVHSLLDTTLTSLEKAPEL